MAARTAGIIEALERTPPPSSDSPSVRERAGLALPNDSRLRMSSTLPIKNLRLKLLWMPQSLKRRLLTFLVADPLCSFCSRCLAESIGATRADVRATIKVMLATHAGIAIRRSACARCRIVGAVVMLKA
jgi:hypothetical protein